MFVHGNKKEEVQTESSTDKNGSIFEFFSGGGGCCACSGGLEGVDDDAPVTEEGEGHSSVEGSPAQKRNHTWLRRPKTKVSGKRAEKDFF